MSVRPDSVTDPATRGDVSAFDHVPVGLMSSTCDGAILDANTTLASMLGYPNRETLLARNLDAIGISPAIRDSWVDTGGAVREVSCRLIRYDGTALDVIIHSRAQRDGGGTIVSHHCAIEDAAQTRRLEQWIRDSEQRYRQLFTQNLTPMVVTRPDGRIVDCNAALIELLDFDSRETLLAQNASTFYPDPETRKVYLDRLLAEGQLRFIEAGLMRRDGKVLTVLGSARLMDVPDGETVIETSFVDITPLKETQEALQRSLRERDALIREVHHRVKNNLQVISSLLSLQSQSAASPDVERFVRDSQHRLYAMGLVHELLYQSDRIATVQLRTYTSRLVSTITASYSAERRQIRWEVRGDDVPVKLDDAVRCGLIVDELVVNAIKHAFPERGGTVVVTITRDAARPNRLTVAVADDGVGMTPPADVDRVSTLGLRLVANMAREAGGRATWQQDRGTIAVVEMRIS